MAHPLRIQRKRTAGWRMPEGAVYVGRPGKWGNPFLFFPESVAEDLPLRLFGELARGCWNPSHVLPYSHECSIHVYRTHQKWLARLGGHPLELIPAYLRGKQLACWCRLDQPCHADILAELANEPQPRPAGKGEG